MRPDKQIINFGNKEVVNYSAIANKAKSLSDGIRSIDFDRINDSITFNSSLVHNRPKIQIKPSNNSINNVSEINFNDNSTLTGITSDSSNTDPTKAISSAIMIDVNNRIENLESKTQNQTATQNETTFTGNITADTFNGYHLGFNNRFYTLPAIPFVNSDLVMEVGRYIDFHYNAASGTDYTSRLYISKPGTLYYDHSFIVNGGDIKARNCISDNGNLHDAINKIAALETKNTEQDTRLTNIETKNTEQDGRLDVLEDSKLTVVHYSTNASINVVCLDGLDEYIYRPRFKVSIIFEDSEYYPTFTSENTLLASYVVNLKIINNDNLYSLTKKIYSREVDGKVEISSSNTIILNWDIQKGRIDINLTDDGSQPIIILGINDQNYYPNALIQYPVVDNYLVSKNLAHDNEERLTAATNKNNEQDTRLTNIETKNTEQDTRLTNIETKNTEQDTRLTNIETKNNEQDTRLKNIETKNTEQDTRIGSIEEMDTAQNENIRNINTKDNEQDTRLDALEIVNTEQDTRLTNIEIKNIEQDIRIDALESKNTEQNTRLDDLEKYKLSVTYKAGSVTPDITHEFTPEFSEELTDVFNIKFNIIFEEKTYFPIFAAGNNKLLYFEIKYYEMVDGTQQTSIAGNTVSAINENGNVILSGNNNNYIMNNFIIEKGKISLDMTYKNPNHTEPSMWHGWLSGTLVKYYQNAVLSQPSINEYFISKNLAHDNEERLSAATNKNTEQDTRISKLESKISNLLNSIYPVGSIYLSLTKSPPSLGGTWELIDEGKFLYSTTSTSGETGGSLHHTHATSGHVLTTGEMPMHKHTFNGNKISGTISDMMIYDGKGMKKENPTGCFSWEKYGSQTWNGQNGSNAGLKISFTTTPTGSISYEGNNQAHTHGNTEAEYHIPPYITCFMYKRTA